VIELVVVGIVAGFLAGISPCILPVLPVVLVAGATGATGGTGGTGGTVASSPGDAETPARVPRAHLARSLAVIGGLVLSFSIIVLAGSEILSLLHLPQDALRDAGIVLLIVYHFPTPLPLGALGLAGTWTDHAQEATAGTGAEMELSFLAQDVYLVLGGTGTLDVSYDGHHTQTIDVGGTPRLYTLYQAGSAATGTLLLQASPGVQAYDFTFG
jgi:hypothetical protein